MNFRLITVGIADIQVANPPDILRTILGSCVGICLYDARNLIGGLAHIMLPKMNQAEGNKKKYADTAIPILLEEMQNKGADRQHITAKIFGGATMFKLSAGNGTANIGKINIDGVCKALHELKIRIIAEDLGGDFGRTIDFFMDTGEVKVKSLNNNIRIM